MDTETLKQILSSDNFTLKYGFKEVTFTDMVVTIRSNISNEEQANKFSKDFGLASKTSWIVVQKPTVKRLLFSKTWCCKHSKRNKRAKSGLKNCRAHIRIVIKDATRSCDPFLKKFPNVPAIIKVHFNHSHNIYADKDLRMLPLSKQEVQKFREYFSSGMTVAEARVFHAKSLDGGIVNGSPNLLKSRKIRYLFEVWKKDNLKSPENPFGKFAEEIPNLEKQGAVVRMECRTPWVVVIVTPIMERAQSLRTSNDVIFVDTMSSCANKSSITLLITVTSAGAIPIVVFLHENQSTECYEKAFGLLKREFPNCFGGCVEGPDVFITGDSDSVQSALGDVWPTAKLLLCQPQVSQDMWMWLFSRNTPASEHQRLMKILHRIMYAEDLNSLDEAVKDVYREVNHPEFVVKVADFMERRAEWVSLYREEIVAWNDAIKYTEASVRLLNDVIMEQSKGYNTVAMAEFCVLGLENYLKMQLLDHAKNGRANDDVARCYLRCIRKYIQQISEHLYLAPDAGRKKPVSLDILHTVDTLFGVCTCDSGQFNGFCKHLQALFRKCHLTFVEDPSLTWNQRYTIAHLASWLSPSPHQNFLESKEEGISEMEAENSIKDLIKSIQDSIPPAVSTSDICVDTGFDCEDQSSDASSISDCHCDPADLETSDSEAKNPDVVLATDEDEKKLILQELSRIQDLVLTTTPKLKELLQALRSIKTSADIIEFIKWSESKS